MDRKPIMLMILDGFGINENEKGNAVKLANTPNIDKLMKTWPTTQIHTSGLAVGLPEGQMGNSEVGHTNIGAGRIVYQDLTRITKSIEEGEFFSIKELTSAIDNCKRHNSKLHIMGLLSDGGVHSHIRHLYALLELAKRKDFEDVYVHCLLDGRDTPPASGESYILQLEEKMKEKGVGKIATISGRFYSMDRDKRWDRVEKGYKGCTYIYIKFIIFFCIFVIICYYFVFYLFFFFFFNIKVIVFINDFLIIIFDFVNGIWIIRI